MDGKAEALRQVAAGLQQCLAEGASKEKRHLLFMKGLACIAELKNQNQAVCEETETVNGQALHCSASLATCPPA